MSASDDGGMYVDFKTLRQVSGELERILKEVNGRLEALYTRTEPVVLSWEGEARNRCVDSLDRWSRSLDDLQAAQAWLHDVVKTGEINYTGAHAAVLRGWGGA